MSEFKRVERALDCMLITVVVTRRVEHSHYMRLCDAIVARFYSASLIAICHELMFSSVLNDNLWWTMDIKVLGL